MTALLATAAAAVLAGAKSLVAIGEWVADAPQHVLAQLGFQADPLTGVIRPPHAGTIRLILLAVDGDVLDTAIGRYLQERRPAPEPAGAVRRAIAVDGKVLRGSRTPDQAATALPAAMDHIGNVLAQRQVADKSNEIPAFAPLLDPIDLEHTLITADALHTQHAHGAYLCARGAHYLAVVKKNHPGLHETVSGCPAATSRSTTTTAPAPTTATRSAASRPPGSTTSTTPEPARPSKWCAGDGRRRRAS
ncbi:ISAs1 family transposase [Streptomyces sp. NPDC005236]|uniref:ISAs1 family transposase n=1 Tax=Streptomyces sp. NPDC005236 TaxID=3157028 RepID=UPI0033AA7051